MTEEQMKISAKNRDLRRKELGIKGNKNLVLHHKDTTLRHNNVERYIEWRLEDIEILTKSQHSSLHLALRNKARIYEHREPWNKGKHFKHKDNSNYQGPKPWLRGRHYEVTDEAKAKISLALKKSYEHRDGNAKGKHWFNNGVKETYAFDCPEGFNKGRLKRYAEQSRK